VTPDFIAKSTCIFHFYLYLSKQLFDILSPPSESTVKQKSCYIILGVTLIALFSNCSKNEPVPQELLIAHYPLIGDGIDLTGNNAAMTLQNTPFQSGGIYCNGIYVHSPDPNFCVAQSPRINSFKFESFAISMDFFVSEKRTQPVWIIGTGCRWLGFYLRDDGTVALLYNNWNFLKFQKTYSLNEWHNAKISFDGTIVNILLDNSLAGTLKFGNGYVPLDYTTCSPADTEIGVTNYSNGQVFKGHIKDLKVYNLQ